MKFNNIKKSLLVLTSLCLLASCTETNSSSSEEITPSESEIPSSIDSTKEDQASMTKMINELAKGVALESLVTITSTTGSGDSLQSSYGRFYLDVQTTKTQYAYQQYSMVESNTAIPSKDTLSAKGEYVKNILGYACNNFLGIDNQNYTSLLTQETSQGTSYVGWQDAGLENIFISLKGTMFEKVSTNEFKLKDDTDLELKRRIAANFYGENTLPAVKDFVLTIKDGRISEYSISTEVQKRYDSTYYTSYTLQYEFQGKILGFGEDNAEVRKNFSTPVTGEKDEKLENAFKSLRANNYKEETTVYQVANPSLSEKGSLNSKAIYTYADSVETETIYDSRNKVTSDKAYYITDDNFMQEVIKINGNYYNQGLMLSNSGLSNPYPQFGISSLFFEKKEEGLYHYDYGYKNCQIFSTSSYTGATAAAIYTSDIDLREDGKITISSITVQSANDAVYYFKVVTTYSDINTSVAPFKVSEVSNGDNLTWDEYFQGDAELDTAKKILGEDRFNSIPVLGGYYNDVTLVADEETRTVQMQYFIGSLTIYDFDGDGQISGTELAALYSEIDRTLRPYSQKVDSTMWPDLKAGVISTTSGDGLCVQLSSTQTVPGEDGVDLNFDVFFTYDQYSNDAYIVIETKYNESVTVTFDLNYEGAENIVKKINKGEKVDAEIVKRKGYLFMGWYLDKECTQPASFNEAINENTTFYAKWEAK